MWFLLFAGFENRKGKKGVWRKVWDHTK